MPRVTVELLMDSDSQEPQVFRTEFDMPVIPRIGESICIDCGSHGTYDDITVVDVKYFLNSDEELIGEIAVCLAAQYTDSGNKLIASGWINDT